MDVSELLDRTEIADAITRYTLAVDTGDWDALDTVFTPDAAIDYSESGGVVAGFAEAKTWLAENLPAFSSKRLHMLGQVAVTPAGDRAEVDAYFYNPMVISDGHGGERVVEVGGIYHHDFVRTPDGWRSRALREEVFWTRGF